MAIKSIRSKIIMVLGPTSSGKTDLALKIAKKYHGELVSCDSRQVYRGLDIGTGKLPAQDVTLEKGKNYWKMDGIKVRMYDVADWNRQYTVYDYFKMANRVIDGILNKGKLPIIVGGSGLYLKAFLGGLPNFSVPVDLKLRKQLECFSLDKLQEKLKGVCPQRWEKMNNSDRQNPRRLIRAIEIALVKPGSKIPRKNIEEKFKVLKIGLICPNEILYQRIDERVIGRINQGMIEEAEKLHGMGLSLERMRQLGLEYGVLADYLEGKIKSRDELIRVLQGKIHGYARRQRTWFKKEKNVNWFDITDPAFLASVESKLDSWYYLKHDKKN